METQDQPRKFEVGDRVRVKNTVDRCIRAFGETGTIITIDQVDGDRLIFRVKYDFPHGVRHIQFFENEIELMPRLLNPCPFCGKEMQKFEDNLRESGFTVWCGNCGAIGPNETSKERAIELWNLRRPQARLEKLVTKIAFICAKSMDRAKAVHAIIEEIDDYSKENQNGK